MPTVEMAGIPGALKRRTKKTPRMRDCLSSLEGVDEMKSWRKAGEVRVLGAWSLDELLWPQ